MPCKDSTSQVVIKLDSDERLRDFYFSKLTCSKPIGGGTGYREFCLGRPASELAGMEFAEALNALVAEDEESQFFLYMEWDAMKSALSQYLGHGENLDRERYRISSLVHDGEGVEIQQVIHPPKETPKIIPCSKKPPQSV
jgi:hypothetical protein